MDYNKRIDDNFLKAEYVDGEVLQHTDMNELESVVKLGVNANYEDIQKIQDGTISVENSNKLSDATLSKASSETLQNSDIKVPTSAQVKQYIDSAISSIDLTGYASEIFVENEIADTVEIYDSNGNGIVDNAEKVNNHTVDKDVPSDAKFTDTIYDDTEVRGLISDLDDNKVDKVTGKGLSTNDYTTTEKNKLARIANNAQVNVLEKVSVNGTQQTISNKSVNISVPTQLSQLSDDSTHRLVTDTEKTTWNNKADISDIPSLTNYVKFTDYPTAQKGGVVKANRAGFNVSTSGIPSANVYNYTDYVSTSDDSFVGKGTLDNVITGKNLETANNKVTEITENSTDTEYPSAKAVYGFTNNISEELKEEDEYLNSVIEQLPRDEATGTSATLQPTIQARMKMSLAPSELEQTTYTGKNLLDLIGNSSNGLTTEVTNGSQLSITGTATSDWANITTQKDVALPSGTYTFSVDNALTDFAIRIRCTLENSSTATNSIRIGQTSTTFTLEQNTTKLYLFIEGANLSGKTLNKILKLQLESGPNSTNWEPYTGGTASPNPEYPQDIHTISGDNSVVVEGKNIVYDVSYKSTKNQYYPLVQPSFNIVENEYYAISVDTPNTGLKCYINLPNSYGLTRVSSNYDETLDGTRKTWIAKATTTKSLATVSLINRASATSDVETGLLSNFQIEHIASASDTSTAYEPYVSQTAPINLPVENLFDKDGTNFDNHTGINNFNGKQVASNTFVGSSCYNLVSNNARCQLYFKGTIGKTYYLSYKSGYEVTAVKAFGSDGIITETSTVQNQITMTNEYIGISMKKSDGTDFTDAQVLELKNSIQIEKGTKANTYTPYGTTPIEYCKIGDYEDEFILTSGKNFISIPSNCVITGGPNIIDLETPIPIGTYIASIDSFINGGTNKGLIHFLDNNNTQIAYALLDNSNKTATINITSPITKLRLYSQNSASASVGITSTFVNMMVSKNGGDYEPYGTNQWYLKKNIGKVVLDGSENWGNFQIESSGLGRAMCSMTNVYYKDTEATILCDKLVGVKYSGSWNNTYDCIANYNNNRFIVYLNGATDLTTFTNKLASGFTCYYVMATPTYTQITGTLETQLNNIYEKLLSYKGTTNISQVNNDLPFVLGVSAIKDINAMISELTNAVIELGGE